MVNPALESCRAASLDGSANVGSAASGRSMPPTEAKVSGPGPFSANSSSAARKNCSRPESAFTPPPLLSPPRSGEGRWGPGRFQFEQVPAAIEPAGQQALFLLQLRHLARELVDIGVQEIEAV